MRGRGFELTGAAGPVYETRGGGSRSGLRCNLDIDGGELIRGLRGEGWFENLPSGNDFSWSVAYRGEHGLIGEAVDRLSARISHSRQREFAFGGGRLDRRIDEDIQLTNRLTSGASSPLRLAWNSEFRRRRSSHRSPLGSYDDREFNWRNGLEVDWGTGSFATRLSGGIDLQEQQYAGGLTQGRHTRLGLTVWFYGSSSDTLSLTTATTKYRFDTPDKADYNDRDELRYKVELLGRWMITPRFSFRADFAADLRHLVYIYRPRSGENRRERSFRLGAALPWNDVNLVNVARFTVTSRYTDYDFPPADESLSRVYRAFSAADSMRVNLPGGGYVKISSALVLDDHGRLRWEDWIEDISEDGYSFTLAVAPVYEWKGCRWGFGWSWHRRETRLHLGDGRTEPGESILSSGPVFSVASLRKRPFHAELTGRVLEVSDRLRGSYRLPDVTCSLVWSPDLR